MDAIEKCSVASLTDDQIEDMIADTAKIEVRDHARELIDIIEREISGIEMQLEAKTIQASGRHLSPEEDAWVYRATYAKAMKKREVERVYRRDRELRHQAQRAEITEARVSKLSLHLAKQERFRAEAVAKSLATRENVLKQEEKARDAKALRSFERKFYQIARERLPGDLLAEITAGARDETHASLTLPTVSRTG